MSTGLRGTAALSAAMALTLVVLQFAVVRFATDDRLVRVVLPATIALAPAVLWARRARRARLGTWVIIVGLAANLAPVLANGGLMPIERSTVEAAVGSERAATYPDGEWIPGSKDVLVEHGDGRLTALGDGIIVKVGSRGVAASPGDIVILTGVLLLAAEFGLSATRRRPAREQDEVIEERLPRAA